MEIPFCKHDVVNAPCFNADTICPRNSYPLYRNLVYKMWHYFLVTQYFHCEQVSIGHRPQNRMDSSPTTRVDPPETARCSDSLGTIHMTDDESRGQGLLT